MQTIRIRTREWLFAWAALSIAVLAAYCPVTIGAESFYHHDRYFLHVPFWHAAWNALAQGDFPFWVHGIRAGYPLFANGEASLLYPLTYAFAPFYPSHRALDLFTLFHLILGGWFCWLFLRQLTGHSAIALIGAVAFALSGRLNGMTIWGHAVAAAAYLPLLLWAIDRRSILYMSLAIGLGALTGRPQVHALSLLIGAAYATLRVIQSWREYGRAPVSHAAAVGAAFAIGLCLGSPQILPTLLFVGESTRDAGTVLAEWNSNTLGTVNLPEMLFPGAFPRGWPEAASYPTIFVYAGICISLVRLLVARTTGRSDTLFWLALTAISLYAAFGGPGAYGLTQELPLIRSFRVPARFAYIASFACIVVAVLAWRPVLTARQGWSWLLLGVVLLDGTAAASFSRHTVVASAYEQRQQLVGQLRRRRDETGSQRRYFADPLWIPPAQLEDVDQEAVERMFAGLPPSRNLAMRHGLRSVQGYGEPCFPWVPQGRQRITPNMFRQLGTEILIFHDPVVHPALELVGSAGNWHAYRMQAPLACAQVVYEAIRAKEATEAFAAASAAGFDSQNRVIVEDDVPGVPSGVRASSSVRVASESSNRIVLEVYSASPGYLVLYDSWAPGWSAAVDQAEQPVRRANGLFRLVNIPSGNSSVEFTYLPPGLVAGLWLALLGFLALILIGSRLARPR